MGTCHECGATIADKVGFRDTCPQCDAYLHCCLNCRLYSPSAHNHCLSSTTEFVRDVSTANYCEEFDFTSRKKKDEGPAARDRFDKLFGG